MSWLDRFRSKRERRKHDAPEVKCKAVGVYATVHTSRGDFKSLGPSEINIDCEIITFTFPVDLPTGPTRIISSTLHFGVTNVELAIHPIPEGLLVGADDTVYVVHSVSMSEMIASGGQLPAWAQ